MLLRCRDLWCFATVYTRRGGVGWGGVGGVMLTFLVLHTLYVATLQRSLVLLLRCIHEGVGWGGVGGVMLTFLVLRTLYVATLQRSPVLKLRCIHERVGWGSKSKDLLLYVKCWQWRYVNLHTRLQQKTISTLKRLVWKDNKKRLSNESNEKCLKPSRNANLAKFSRENLAKFG